MHTESLYDLLFLVASRIYLVCHWNQFRIFLTSEYLRAVQANQHSAVRKGCCEVLWTDRAGKSSGSSGWLHYPSESCRAATGRNTAH